MDALKRHWPAVLVAAALGTTTVGTILAAIGHPAAAIPVVGSNLSMVLALGGASLLVFSSMLWYGIYKKERPETGFINPNVVILCALIATTLVSAPFYGGIHWGIGAVLTDLSVGQSIAAQTGIGFAVGAIIALGQFAIATKPKNEAQKWTDNMRDKWRNGLIKLIGTPLLCAGSTALGPTFSLFLGVDAISSTEAMAMEIMVAVGLASLVMMNAVIAKEVEHHFNPPSRI